MLSSSIGVDGRFWKLGLACVLGAMVCLPLGGVCKAQEATTADSKSSGSENWQRFPVRLEPFKRVRLSAKQDGFITMENLTPGTIIKEGETIAELDTKRRLLQAKRLRAEIDALREQVDDKTDLVRSEQEIKSSSYRFQELNAASRRTRIPRMELVEAETKLASDRAALSGAVSRISQAKYTLAAKEAELELLNLDIENSIIAAPFDGTIITQFKHLGEAVSPQEPLAEAYRLDYLLASTFFAQSEISLERFAGITGVVEFKLPNGKVESFEIESPKTLPRLERDGRYLGVLKIKNRKRTLANERVVWALLPGMEGELAIGPDTQSATQ